MSIFKKDPKEFEVNGKTVKIRPLGLKVIFKLKNLKGPMAEAIAKLKPLNVNNFEKIVHSTPMPTEADPDAIEMIDKTTTSAPSVANVAQTVVNRAQGVEAIFDCILQDDLLADILKDSVEELHDTPREEILEQIDIPTAFELFGCIVQVNKGGFESLGKYWLPLKSFLDGVEGEGATKDK